MCGHRWLVVGAALLLVGTAGAQTRKGKAEPARPGAGIEERTLKNGLKVIVWPAQDIPTVAFFNWFRVGSRNESPGITGLSHFFEHMMFNGAKKYGPGEFDRVMEAAGGSNNAYTSEDVTVYQDWFPRTALETIFELEADRLAHLAFDPKVVESERGVVYSERRSSVDNDNMGALAEQVQATAFVAHPYQYPVIGWPSDIESWRLEDLRRYFQTYYAPNNATLVVVGAVTPAEVFTLAEKFLGPIPAQPAPAPVRTQEPEQQGERRVTVRRLAQAPLLQMAWHGLAATDSDAPALEMLMGLLTEGDSSRLHRKLVEEEQVALSVASHFGPSLDPSLVWVLVELPPGGDVARVEALLNAELARLGQQGVTEAELRKAKNKTVADFWRGLETHSSRAQLLGSYEVFQGDWRKLFEAPARYEQVTREQMRKLAAKLFIQDHRTVGVLVPTGAAPEQAVPATPGAGQ
ncbi:M16 family metallopeptidase [Stigmatella aurantiaca]|uniref:Peptidase, M16 (Pitrilysin) family n=1 Tax=Stigmatella aurantiaca (strain DW4/3-1) TaxID=378806 RepID=Q09DU6_STIAD|nr:pitrilysin family protein [Stigmatella aurantiaca]ADO75218.1 Peptidase, M16 (Pitrilysin) family [Stigmatella aurantiaca DW4/3-1]EAU69876.1 zinc protease [Stigmatella aurantiaca DW4/3-1]